MNSSEAIQIGVGIVLTFTLGAVLWYAWESRKQAKASMRMALEMERARCDAARPVMEVSTRRAMAGELLVASTTRPPPVLNCELRNVGMGPALNVEVDIRDGNGNVVGRRLGVFGVGESIPQNLLAIRVLEQGVKGLLQVRYEDVFGNTWFSEYELSASEERVEFGPLSLRQIVSQGKSVEADASTAIVEM